MMIGDTQIRERAARKERSRTATIVLELAGLYAEDDEGLPAIEAVNLKVQAGEIVGIAGVSGNGQSRAGRGAVGPAAADDGGIFIQREPFEPTRDTFDRMKVFGLPEEPLKNATVPRMTVAENMAFRTFDKPPTASSAGGCRPGRCASKARELIARYRVKTPSPETADRDLSGGNVQRAVLARELSGDVDVLIVANPCFGLDFASVAEIRAQIMEQRNRGAAVLLVSRGPRRDPRARRPRRRDVGRHDQLRLAGRRDRPQHHRPAHGRALRYCFERGYWWARQDSNLQPSGYEPPALTIELRARRVRRAAPLEHFWPEVKSIENGRHESRAPRMPDRRPRRANNYRKWRIGHM